MRKIASALVVNPLDVVKTRMQAQAAAAAGQRLAAPHLLEKIAVAGCSPSCHPATGAACYTADCFAYGSTLDGMRKIVRREGTMMLWRGTDVALLMAVPMLNRGNGLAVNIRSMYTGVGATLARDVPFSAIYWGLLEPIRSSLTPTDGRHIPHSETLGINFLAGCIGGAAAAAITTPLDVVKTRVQLTENQHRRMPILRTMQEIAQGGGGPRGLFVGAGPRAARAAPACAIVLACYEGIKAVCIDGC
ncbi:hypothetical protein WJX72_009672 [[Myrmecia] bisecta]|uniref:Mitochondrial carrier protein n=1 Tax=[Myrmecia] bisecta TaxID=41462 RepID=A0AAW1Q5E2_9CHLO